MRGMVPDFPLRGTVCCVTQKVDLTAPVLPRVEDRDERPDTTAPSLPRVNETAAALEPVVDERLTSSTLELDPQEDVITDERPVYRPRSVRKNVEPEPPRPQSPRKPSRLDVLAATETTGQRRAIRRPMRSDGFEGASMENMVPAEQATPSPLVTAMQKGGWVVVALAVASLVLIAVLAWQFF